MTVDLGLHEGETIEKEVAGDYWEGAIMGSKKPGKYWFTNERILFRGGFIASLDLPYSQIASVAPCNVGELLKFLPTGIMVTMKDGKKYRLSLLKRKEIIEVIQAKL